MKNIKLALILFTFSTITINAQLKQDINGNVTIGNYTANSKLTVSNNGTTEIKTYATGSNLIARNWVMNDTYAYGIGISGSYGYIYQNSNSPSAIMTFNSTGRVGVGESPSAQLSVNSTYDPFRVRKGGSTKLFVASNGGVNIGTFNSYANENCLWVNGTITEYSDEKSKENVESIPLALNKVLNLRGITYNQKMYFGKDINLKSSNSTIEKENTKIIDKKEIGLIAQEVEKIVPEAVTTTFDGTKGIKYSKLTALLIEAMKEQQKQIEDLKAEVVQLSSIAYNNDNMLFPNPVKLQANLDITIPNNATKAVLNIYAIDGQLIKEINIKDRGASKINFDTSNLESGIYNLCLIADGNIIASTKMIKQ